LAKAGSDFGVATTTRLSARPRQGVRPHKSRREVLRQRLRATQFPSRKATMTDPPPTPGPPATHRPGGLRGLAEGGLGPRGEGGDDPSPKPPPMAIRCRIKGVPMSQPLRPGLLGHPFSPLAPDGG